MARSPISFPVLIVLAVVAYKVWRAFMDAQAARNANNHGKDETEEQRRVREVQERIRRAIAERTGGAPPRQMTLPPVQPASEPPVFRRVTTPVPPLEPFGGPLKRMLVQLERKLETPPPVVQESRNAELERQEQLTEKMRVLAEDRELAKHRATRAAAAVESEAKSEAGQLSSARRRLDQDLADSGSLRRAFMLREVLGPPMALR